LRAPDDRSQPLADTVRLARQTSGTMQLAPLAVPMIATRVASFQSFIDAHKDNCL